jgi:hypothetical protein
MYLFQVTAPDEAKGAWDYFNLVKTNPAAQAYVDPKESGCPLVKWLFSGEPRLATGAWCPISAALTTQVLRALLWCSNHVESACFDVSSLDFGRPQGRPFFLAERPGDTIQSWINKDQGGSQNAD